MTERMRAVDAAWLHMDQPTNLMVITSVTWFDEPLDWDAHTKVLEERMVGRFPRLRQRVVDHDVGRPRWEDDPHFDLNLHLQHVALPDPGDHATLQEFVGDVMSRDLDHRRPLWQMWLVDNYKGGSATVFRIHHAVGDGMALTAMLFAMTDEGRDLPLGEATSRGVLSRLRQAADVGRDVLTHPGKILEGLRTGAGVAQALVHDAVLPSDSDTAFKGHQSARKVVAWAEDLDLEMVKSVAHNHDATVNDLLMAALSGSLGRYLDDVGTPAEQVRALVPVNLRPLDQLVPESLGNDFGLVFCPLPVGQVDRLRRLDAVKQAMDHIKSTPEAITSLGLLGSMGSTPRAMEELMVDFFGDKASMVVTNVPGPPTPLHMDGVPIAGVLSWAPQSGPVSMSVTIFSYAGKVIVGVATDPALVEDPETIVANLEDEVTRYRAMG